MRERGKNLKRRAQNRDIDLFWSESFLFCALLEDGLRGKGFPRMKRKVENESKFEFFSFILVLLSSTTIRENGRESGNEKIDNIATR